MSSSDLDLFDVAGMKKNVFLDRWEFFWGSTSNDSATTVDSSRCSADDDQNAATKSEDVSILDEIDLTALRIGNDVSTGATAVKPTGGGKKKKKKKTVTAAAMNSSKPSARSVRWGDVEQILFSRSVSYDGVPTKGKVTG